jgi:uncharacterized protein (TIGR02453 family)
MAFEGFADANAKFFSALAKHQNRDWFQAHKAQFEEGYNEPMKALLHEVRSAVDKSFRHCDLDEPKIFRIYRDVRFSKDKSPYKTHIGGVIPVKRGGKMTEVPMALYFHVGQPHPFGAAGHYMMDPPALDRFRKAVADDKRGRELDKILATLEKKGFSIDSHGTYARVPKGYDPAHPRAEHLKRKGLTVGFPSLPKGILAQKKLVPWLATQSITSAPLVEWLVFATA